MVMVGYGFIGLTVFQVQEGLLVCLILIRKSRRTFDSSLPKVLVQPFPLKWVRQKKVIGLCD